MAALLAAGCGTGASPAAAPSTNNSAARSASTPLLPSTPPPPSTSPPPSTLPRTIHAGAATTITVHIQITDCARPGRLALLARVPRWWGTATVRLIPSDLPDPLVAAACGRG